MPPWLLPAHAGGTDRVVNGRASAQAAKATANGEDARGTTGNRANSANQSSAWARCRPARACCEPEAADTGQSPNRAVPASRQPAGDRGRHRGGQRDRRNSNTARTRRLQRSDPLKVMAGSFWKLLCVIRRIMKSAFSMPCWHRSGTCVVQQDMSNFGVSARRRGQKRDAGKRKEAGSRSMAENDRGATTPHHGELCEVGAEHGNDLGLVKRRQADPVHRGQHVPVQKRLVLMRSVNRQQKDRSATRNRHQDVQLGIASRMEADLARDEDSGSIKLDRKLHRGPGNSTNEKATNGRLQRGSPIRPRCGCRIDRGRTAELHWQSAKSCQTLGQHTNLNTDLASTTQRATRAHKRDPTERAECVLVPTVPLLTSELGIRIVKSAWPMPCTIGRETKLQPDPRQ